MATSLGDRKVPDGGGVGINVLVPGLGASAGIAIDRTTEFPAESDARRLRAEEVLFEREPANGHPRLRTHCEITFRAELHDERRAVLEVPDPRLAQGEGADRRRIQPILQAATETKTPLRQACLEERRHPVVQIFRSPMMPVHDAKTGNTLTGDSL